MTVVDYLPFATELNAVARLLDFDLWPIPIFGVLSVGDTGERRCACGNPDCPQAGKHPARKFAYYHEREDVRPIQRHDLRDWMERYRYHHISKPLNWGIHLGRSQLVGIDVDPRNGGNESLALIESRFGLLPLTVTDRTETRGLHFLYQSPVAGVLPNLAKMEVLPGIDVKQLGGYIIVPPSVHRCGHPLLWEPNRAPWEIQFAPFPQLLVDLVNEWAESRPQAETVQEREQRRAASSYLAAKSSFPHYPTIDLGSKIEQARRYVSSIPGAVMGEDGDKQTYTVACKLIIDFDLPYHAALDIFQDWNQKCSPPWVPGEVNGLEYKLDKASRLPGPRGGKLRENRDAAGYVYTDPRWTGTGEFADLASVNVDGYATTAPAAGAQPAVVVGSESGPSAGTDGATVTGQPLRHTVSFDFAQLAEKLDGLSATAAEDAAAAEVHYAEYHRSLCQNPRHILLRSIETGQLFGGDMRCRRRLTCPYCREFFDNRDLVNIQTRLTVAMQDKFKVVYSLNCSEDAWPSVARQINRLAGNYFRVRTHDYLSDGSNVAGFTVFTDAAGIDLAYPVAKPIESVENAIGVCKTLFEVCDHNRPATSSHGWRLLKKKKPGGAGEGKDDAPKFVRVGEAARSLDLPAITGLAIKHGYAVVLKSVREHNRNVAIQSFYAFQACGKHDEQNDLIASLSLGEWMPPMALLPLEDDADDGTPVNRLKPGTQPANVLETMGLN
jgi:hypothetical protein